MRKTYWIWYNGKYIQRFKSLNACLNYVKRHELTDDYNNELCITDEIGNLYNPFTGRVTYSIDENAKMTSRDIKLLEGLVYKHGKIKLLNEMKNNVIVIRGEEYSIIDPYDRIDPEEWDDSFAMINCLKRGECMSFYNGTWCYRDINGKIWQCYKDDQENYWSI